VACVDYGLFAASRRLFLGSVIAPAMMVIKVRTGPGAKGVWTAARQPGRRPRSHPGNNNTAIRNTSKPDHLLSAELARRNVLGRDECSGAVF
jgi:hypothetical protein